MRLFFAVLFVFMLALAMESCREGCKDKNAINYDSRATVENGTCMYCTGGITADTATYAFTCFEAPNPNVNSVEFIVVNTNSSISGNGCQAEGKQVGSACKNYLRIVNLTNESISGEFSVEFFQNGIEGWFFENNASAIQLGPLDTLNFGVVDSFFCSNLTTGTLTGNTGDLQFF